MVSIMDSESMYLNIQALSASALQTSDMPPMQLSDSTGGSINSLAVLSTPVMLQGWGLASLWQELMGSNLVDEEAHDGELRQELDIYADEPDSDRRHARPCKSSPWLEDSLDICRCRFSDSRRSLCVRLRASCNAGSHSHIKAYSDVNSILLLLSNPQNKVICKAQSVLRLRFSIYINAKYA